MTNVILMLLLPFIFRQYRRKVKQEDEHVSERIHIPPWSIIDLYRLFLMHT
jgi:hypothetical protein